MAIFFANNVNTQKTLIINATFFMFISSSTKPFKMKTKLILFVNLFILFSGICNAQNFTFGIENGINFSNIRKTFDHDRFASEPGSINGIFAKYQLNNWLVLQSGINHATFQFNETQHYYPHDYWMLSSSSYYDPLSSSFAPPYYSYSSSNKYSFLRIPLLIKYRTPGRVNFEIGGGYYYSFLTNDEFRGKDKDRFDKEYREENFPDMTDWGWILASSVNYNINNKWSIFASGQITYGKEEYFKNVEGKMGSTELTFGVGYKPFAKSNKITPSDSTGQRISILPHSGLNSSRVKSDKNKNEYGSSTGFSSGVSLLFSFENNVSILTGAWYERKGYALDYSGYHPAIYHVAPNNEPTTQTKSDVQLDYLTIPLMMDVSIGQKIQSHINAGVYYSLLQNAFAEGERTNTYEHQNGYQVQKEYFNESKDVLFKDSDYGFIFGYRIDIPLLKWAKVFASVNQSFGIVNILDDGEDVKSTYSFIEMEKIKNSSTSVLFGLSIPLDKN